MAPEDVDYVEAMAQAGVKIIQATNWWSKWITNPVDIVYNETIRNWTIEAVDFGLGIGPVPSFEEPGASPPERLLNLSLVWGILLGDEEPAWTRYANIESELSPDVAKYADTYRAETGFELKPLLQMNATERWTAAEWYANKTIWVYNFLYDYVRSLAPQAKVIQSLFMPPVWGMVDDIAPPYEAKSDMLSADCYYAFDNPWLLYETIRRYRASCPDRPFLMTIWGTIWDFLNEAGDGLYYKIGSYEQIRRETWLSYVSGIAGLGFFDWAPQNNDSYDWRWGHDRTDLMGRRLFTYIDNLAGQLRWLPQLNSQPEVLVVGNGYQTGEPMLHVDHLRLFTEYDLVNQRCFAYSDLNLSKYSIILMTDRWHLNETVEKINDFVANGGNVIFLGGIRNEETPNVNRARYDIEKNLTELTYDGAMYLNISPGNLLRLDRSYNASFAEAYCLSTEGLTADHHIIANATLYDYGPAHAADGVPLVLYHNSSRPGSGWMLYCGPNHFSTKPNVTAETYDYDNEPEMRALYRRVVRSFARFLNITNSISSNDTENVLVTQGLVDDGLLAAGICNFNNETRTFNYTVDIARFGLPDGTYWVHSLDSNSSLGSHLAVNGTLRVPVSVVANGTRILYISQERPSPSFALDIFPHIPRPEDLPPLPGNDTTTTTTTSTSTTSTSTSTTTTTTSTVSEITTTAVSPTGGGGILLPTAIGAVAAVLVVVLVLRKRRGA